MKNLRLKHQLKNDGASQQEAEALSYTAAQMRHLDVPDLRLEAKSRIANEVGFNYNPHRQSIIRVWQTAIALLLIIVVVFAQSAQPGSAFYRVKQGSDKVESIVRSLPLIPDEKPSVELLNDSNERQGSGSNSLGSDDSDERGSGDDPKQGTSGDEPGGNDTSGSGSDSDDSSGSRGSGSDSENSGRGSSD